MHKAIELIELLHQNRSLSKEDFTYLLENRNTEVSEVLFSHSSLVSKKHFGNRVYIRGLIELSSYCKNDCYYCGIRRSNREASRYRLSKEEILDCCAGGYDLGFRTFVLQGGEDIYFHDERMIDIISTIKKRYGDCAVTLSLGEKSYETYQAYYNAGADRYLLRHETANSEHFSKIHPEYLSLDVRKNCLLHLKKIGYQVGTGFMVGSPYQTMDNIVEDLLFIQELSPQMIGIGPFIPHQDTPFFNQKAGSPDLTLYLLGILRLMFPNALLPSTTALGTIDPNGREKGILAGANVVMPNLSPVTVRKKYSLYNNKICTGEEAAECLERLNRRMQNIGYEIVIDRGDFEEGM